MQKNFYFVPPFAVKKGGTKGQFFCIDPRDGKGYEIFRFITSAMGTKMVFFHIDPGKDIA